MRRRRVRTQHRRHHRARDGDMEQMQTNLRDIVGRKNPLLLAAADQIFGAGGSVFAPCSSSSWRTAQLMEMEDITDRQRRSRRSRR